MDATEVDVKMQQEGNDDTNEKKGRKDESGKDITQTNTDSGCGSAGLSPSKNANLDDTDVKMKQASSEGSAPSDTASGSQFPVLPPLTLEEIREIALPGEKPPETSTSKKTALGFSHGDGTNWMEVKDKSLENEAYAGASFDLLPACKAPQETTVEVCQKEDSMDVKETAPTMPEQVTQEGDGDPSKPPLPPLGSLVTEKGRTVNCSVCHKYVRVLQLEKHMATHTKPFHCELCPRKFAEMNHLKNHMQFHAREKVFVCKICNMSFRKKGQFLNHWHKHPENNPFTCDVCNKSFPRWDILTKHKVYHAKEQAYGDKKQMRKTTPRKDLILGCMNVRGCVSEKKRNDIGCMMEERKLDVLALSETHVTGKGEVMFGKIKGQVSGVEMGQAREGVAILVSESLQDKVIEYKYVTSRIMWVRMKIEREYWVFVSAYGPGYETTVQEQIEFWSKLTKCVDKLQKRASVLVLGDLNARVGSSVINGVIGRFGVPGRDDNGMRLLEMCLKKKLAIGNTFFKKKMIHKYTHTQMVYGGMKDKAITDYVIISRRVFGRLKDVHVSRSVAAFTDHFLVRTKLAVGRVKVLKGAAGEGTSESGGAENETEEPGESESDLVGEGEPEQPGVPGESDNDEVQGEGDSDGAPGKSDSEGVPGKSDDDGVPGKSGSEGVPGKSDSEGVPGKSDSEGVPGKSDSEGVPGKSDSEGISGKSDSEGISGNSDSEGVPGKADIDEVPSKDVGEVGGEVIAEGTGVPGQADSDVVVEVGTKRTREETGIPGEVDCDGAGEVGAKKAREGTGVPGEADRDGAGDVGAKEATEETGGPDKANGDVGE